jgi:cysteine desulfurase/selenocysteine lyase
MVILEHTRKDFPILSRTFNGRVLAYLDNAATTQKPIQVIEAVRNFYAYSNSNVHRGAYGLAEEATELYESSREHIARFIGADPNEVVFVRGATEAINLVAYALGSKKLRRGHKVLVTEMEHHSNLVPWQLLGSKGIKLDFLRIHDRGELSLDEFQNKLDDSVKLVAVTQTSNVLGTINPVKEMVELAHDNGSLVLVDGAQSVPHMETNVERLDADFLAFSGHKMLGPMGIGCLYAKSVHLREMDPFQGGGEMINTVSLHHSTWADPPAKFEAGTPNVEGAVGLAAAVGYLENLGMENVRLHEEKLVDYTLKRMREIDAEVYGLTEPKKRGGVVSFNIKGVHPHDLATILDEKAIAVRAGHHCAQPIMRWLSVPATARASFYIYNTLEEVDRLIAGLEDVKNVFHKVEVKQNKRNLPRKHSLPL